MTVAGRSRDTGLRSFAVVVVMVLLLSWLQYDPGSDAGSSVGTGPRELAPVVDGEDGPLDEADVTPDGEGIPGDAVAPDGSTPDSNGGPNLRKGTPGLECRGGKNGGRTDKGVSGSKIRLASTAAQDGAASSLLADSVVAMKAVIDKTNRSGGICGRLLDLTVVNDSFDSARGQRTIKNFIDEDYFALPVVPSAEGLGSAIGGGDISRAGIPVVGTDGMRQEQYNDPWVWPVASATVTAMRTMAKYGATVRGAKTFGIVYDRKYQFGIEGKQAFIKQVTDMGFTVRAEVGIDPAVQNYGPDVNEFNGDTKCGTPGPGAKCDMVAMLLLPDTAKLWLQKNPSLGKLYTAGAQTLFTDRFAQDCVLQANAACHGFAVWTGYNPPVGALSALPGVSTYVQDVRAVKSSIDVTNQFVEGAYLGMSVLVEALKTVGPQLTRARLRAVLDAMDYKSDLASTLTWRPNKHAANVRSQSFSMSVSQGTFRGWSHDSGFLLDPAHGG